MGNRRCDDHSEDGLKLSGLLEHLLTCITWNQEDILVTLIAVGVLRRTKWGPVCLGCSSVGLEDLRCIRSPRVMRGSGFGLSIGCRS